MPAKTAPMTVRIRRAVTSQPRCRATPAQTPPSTFSLRGLVSLMRSLLQVADFSTTQAYGLAQLVLALRDAVPVEAKTKKPPRCRSYARVSVAPTGVDPVTFRFSVERSTN